MLPVIAQSQATPQQAPHITIGPEILAQVILPATIAGIGWFGRQWWEARHRRMEAQIESERARYRLVETQEAGELKIIESLIEAQTQTNRELIAAQKENVVEMRGLKEAVHELAVSTGSRCDRLEQRLNEMEYRRAISPPQPLFRPESGAWLHAEPEQQRRVGSWQGAMPQPGSRGQA